MGVPYCSYFVSLFLLAVFDFQLDRFYGLGFPILEEFLPRILNAHTLVTPCRQGATSVPRSKDIADLAG